MGTHDLPRAHRRLILFVFLGFAAFLILAALLYKAAFGPVWKVGENQEFLVSPNESVDAIGADLESKGFVRNRWVFELAYLREGAGKPIRPGGYNISKSMDVWTIATQLMQTPYLAWVTVPVGARKEQVTDILASTLGWGDKQRAEWDAANAAAGPEYADGVYWPDTYLILTEEPPAQIAEQLREHFRETFAPYAGEAAKEKMPWTEVLTIASLIEREAGSASDMPIISGVIQKRLKVGMPLAIDATLQYMEGKEGNWWPRLDSVSTYPDDPFNTYTRKGLPPHPIAEPSTAAIEAALHPIATDCLFYIHDTHGQMHCSSTYSGHLANIQKYLR